MKRHTHNQGFSLIELMVVIAIIGILASIATPAYRAYTYKARIAETIGYAGTAAQQVSNFLIDIGAVPGAGNGFVNTTANVFTSTNTVCTSLSTATGTVTTPNSVATASWTISPNCRASAISTTTAVGGGTAVTITMTPNIAADGSISINCGSGSSIYAPGTCQ